MTDAEHNCVCGHNHLWLDNTRCEECCEEECECEEYVEAAGVLELKPLAREVGGAD